ncbi:MAG: efflux RND transporter periplasmic adaptor subunit [Chitinophagaceae bacterium]|nr:efflux RND transporter periplasmic adaptor subunit [Chitinophagaceae bacterium]
MLKNSILLFWLPAAALLTLSACKSQKDQAAAAPGKFIVVSPEIIDTVYAREYIAEIQSVQNVEIRSRMDAAFIDKIHVDEGKPVVAVQLLFTLTNRRSREELLKTNAQLKSVQAELKVAEVELKNTRMLVSKNIVSNSELEMAEAKVEAIKARIEEVKSAVSIAGVYVSFGEVRAPFSGVINRIPNKRGSLVREGDLLTTISNNNEVFAYFNMSEKDYLEYRKKHQAGTEEEVGLVLADNQVFPYKGRIETSENEMDISTGNIAFRARFANPDHLLRHGSTGKVLLNSELNNALVIPQKSTFEIQEKIFVYVLDKNNVVRMRNVTVGYRFPHMYVITAGLSKDDRIIYEGIQQVKEGDKVIPEQKSFRALADQ